MAKTSFSSQTEPVTLAVSDELSYSSVADIKAALLDAINQAGEALHIDLSGVTSFDLAGVQLLYAAHRSAEQNSVTLSLEYGDNKERFDKFYRFTGLTPLETIAESENSDA